MASLKKKVEYATTLSEITLCGVDIKWTKRRTPATPFRHRCQCLRLWSSVPVCHRCSCVACAQERANWQARINAARKEHGKRKNKKA